MEIEKLVPDTSVIIEGVVSDKISKKEIKVQEVIIHEAVLAELEHQANENKAIGFLGLDEIKRIKDLAVNFKLTFAGQRPKYAEIKYASLGEIDSMIRQLAYDEGATLMTSDKIQAKVAEAKGMKFLYVEPEKVIKKLKLEKFFDETTMSVHLRENVPPYGKKGFPGNWQFTELRKTPLKQEEIQDISREIIEDAKISKQGFIEIERPGSTIVQLGRYRIVITKPPFSDGWEITAVRPVRYLTLEEYKLSDKLMKRISEQAEGILVAGAPGMGKCLFGDEVIYTTNMTASKVKDLYNSNENVLYSIDKNGRFTEDRILSKHRRKERKIYELKTRTNRRIKVTPEHPLLVFEGNGIKWKEAKFIRKGDNVAVVKRIRNKEDDSIEVLRYYDPEKTLCYVDGNKSIPVYYKFFGTKRKIVEHIYLKGNSTIKEICSYCNKAKSTIGNEIRKLRQDGTIFKLKNAYYLNKKEYNIKDCGFLLLKDAIELDIAKEQIKKIAANTNIKRYINLPKKVTPELCRFLGYIYSEGGGDKISFTNSDQRLVKDFVESARSVFGISGWKRCGLTNYIDWSATFAPFFEACGYPIKKRKKSRTMKLPSFFMRCSLDNVCSFLQAYFDGDGGVDTRTRCIEYYTSSEMAAKQLSMLLLRLGIFSSFRKKFQKGAYRYTLRIFDKESINRFSEFICSKESQKYKGVLHCKDKEYSQTLGYKLKPLLNGLSMETKFKLKDTVSIERCQYLLERLYKIYYDFSSQNENILLVMGEYIDRLRHMRDEFEKNKDKLTWSALRKNHMDHTCLRHWREGRKIKISTLNKIAKVIGCGVRVDPKEISQSVLRSIRQQNLSINDLARECSINAGSLQFKLTHGWEASIEELEKAHNLLYDSFIGKKKEMEYVIKTMEILFSSDILFDKVVENIELEGDFDVYDFETANHNFICGELPMVIHNSTFAQALAEHYASKEKIVKTVEAPRDLVLGENITQYAISHGDAQEIHDILLLSRPDYTIFDEMRNTNDFKLFADLRLAGVGMVGVVHATNPIDAIQRFIGRVEMGVIPQIIDTVVFIKNGFIQKVLSLKMTVKVPSGMTEADLARPVVVVNDFENGKLEYEIYSYGEQTVVIPVAEERKTGAHRLAESTILREFQKYSNNVRVDVVADNKCIVYVSSRDIAQIIGKQGKNIEGIEKRLGMSIDVRENEEKTQAAAKEQEVPSDIRVKKGNILIDLGIKMQNRDVDVYADNEYILSAKAGKTGLIKIKKNNPVGMGVIEALNKGSKIRVIV